MPTRLRAAVATHFTAPLPALAFLAVCLAVAGTWSAWGLGHLPTDAGSVARVVALVALAVAFEERSVRAARMRVRIGADLSQDLTSVWSFGAAIALARGWTVLLICVVVTYKWLRQDRPAGMLAFRWLFNMANVVIASLLACVIYMALAASWVGLPGGLGEFLPVLVTLIVYALFQRVMVTAFLLCRGVPVADLVGTRDENLIEFATLCLGGLLALALTYQPWLIVLVIAPMAALQRGARLREFETAATLDTKTGLLNAVAWEHVARLELTRALRTDSALAVLIIDIDRFKLVNDQYGHLIGDHVLREVGRSLAAGVREYDTVGRFGGEEFVAVLPDATDADALVIAERLRTRINAIRIRDIIEGIDPANEAVMSVSVGVAGLHDPDVELPDLLRGADVALYRAKGTGRNRVVLAEPGVDSAVGRVDARPLA